MSASDTSRSGTRYQNTKRSAGIYTRYPSCGKSKNKRPRRKIIPARGRFNNPFPRQKPSREGGDVSGNEDRTRTARQPQRKRRASAPALGRSIGTARFTFRSYTPLILLLCGSG